jgi:predicted transcriptional regulator with HTH domain
VWRLAGVAAAAGLEAHVFDPNCCEGPPEKALGRALGEGPWDVIGFSTTGMTLRFDLALAHYARRALPRALLVAGGMEATFDPEAMFRLGPFDLVVLGEGERPLLEVTARLRDGKGLEGIAGTASRAPDGRVRRIPQPALTREELRDAILQTPYGRMPYRAYWSKLERAYRVGELPMKAEREARLAEIRSVRLITLNYCPMGCTFCSSTNFLNAAQDSTALIARLDPEECLTMLKRVVAAYPDVRTTIFQDDIFVFPSDRRIVPLCEAILRAKEREEIPPDLQFISTNRIDAMTPERLALMRRAGFRVLGFGIENFSLAVLREFNKARIHPRIQPVLESALGLGMTPFLDVILTSPRCGLPDVAENIRQAYRWTVAGCEVGMYPWVIPFSGSAMAVDPALRPHTTHTRQHVAGTCVSWDQPSMILPLDTAAREAILAIAEEFEAHLSELQRRVAHLPSRVRSLLWVACAVPVLRRMGESMPDREGAVETLVASLPGLVPGERQALRREFAEAALRRAI